MKDEDILPQELYDQLYERAINNAIQEISFCWEIYGDIDIRVKYNDEEIDEKGYDENENSFEDSLYDFYFNLTVEEPRDAYLKPNIKNGNLFLTGTVIRRAKRGGKYEIALFREKDAQ